MHAIVIEQSLEDKNILKDFKILNSKKSDDWDLYILDVENPDEAITKIQPAMVKDKPYYWHIYDDGKILIVIFRDEVFKMDPKNQVSWKAAQEYGEKELSIPAEQLDFYPTTYTNEPEWLAGKD